MSQAIKCPICRNEHGGACTSTPHGDGDWFTCEICGQFIVTRSLQAVLSHKDDTTFPRPKRAAFSHLLRRSWDEHQKPFFMTTTWFDDYLPTARLPTPSEQAINIIRWIGDHIAVTALPIPRLGAEFYARIGAATPRAAHKVTEELISRGLITAMVSKAIGAYTHMQDVDLTLSGWAQYESEKPGYAEGLGKPVLYICERAKFEAAKTHFDTNHLTTVLWEADKPSEFNDQLIATLRRSLNLFPSS